jgi:hypothetical protein
MAMIDSSSLSALLLGEQALFVAIPFLIAILLLAAWFIVWPVKKFRGWNFRQRGAFGILILVVFGGLGSAILAMRPNTGPPDVLPASEIPKLVSALPPYAPFAFSGLAYFHGKLYVTSNIGLIEVVEGQPTQVYRVQRDYSVVSGPWVDDKNQLLWIQDEQTQALLRFDGRHWTRTPMPQPVKGYYSRGDVLEGIRMVHDGSTLWMHAGGSAWRWDHGKGQWIMFPAPLRTPTVEDANETIGVLIVGREPALIVRHEGLAYLVSEEEEFKTDTIVLASNDWKQIPMDTSLRFFAAHWTTVSETGYLCGRDGRVFKITLERVAGLPAPGKCEALTLIGDVPVVSFKNKGVFEYSGDWLLRAPYPYTGGGEYWVHVAAGGGEIAFAVHPKPVVERPQTSGSDIKFERNATGGLWLIRGNQVREVRMLP